MTNWIKEPLKPFSIGSDKPCMFCGDRMPVPKGYPNICWRCQARKERKEEST